MLTLDKAVKQGKSSELAKEQYEILKGDSEDGKLTVFETKKMRLLQEKGKQSEEQKDKKNPSRHSVAQITHYRCTNHQHTNAKKAQPSKQLA